MRFGSEKLRFEPCVSTNQTCNKNCVCGFILTQMAAFLLFSCSWGGDESLTVAPMHGQHSSRSLHGSQQIIPLQLMCTTCFEESLVYSKQYRCVSCYCLSLCPQLPAQGRTRAEHSIKAEGMSERPSLSSAGGSHTYTQWRTRQGEGHGRYGGHGWRGVPDGAAGCGRKGEGRCTEEVTHEVGLKERGR